MQLSSSTVKLVDSKEKFKAQGMYPTPDALAQQVLFDVFQDMRKPPEGLLEPSAGYGAFIIQAWDYWKNRLGSGKPLTVLVASTIAFENDTETYELLKQNIEEWCRKNRIQSRPSLYRKNFLLDHAPITKKMPKSTVVIGNPPWDEFTTRKHDNTALTSVRRIRETRSAESDKYKVLGLKNLYQAFLHELLSISASELRVAMVLPRQMLGDRSASVLRSNLINSGDLFISVYRNKDEPSFAFSEVDANFEIIVLDYRRASIANENKSAINVRRGFGRNWLKIFPCGSDLTIPSPLTQNSAAILRKILNCEPLEAWSETSGIHIRMGGTKCNDKAYDQALNGRKIRPYGLARSKKTSIVVNKILPNSKRKLKAALVPYDANIAESLVVLSSEDESMRAYLLLMLNSKAVELALHALRSNINLNIFRLLSLPIPPPGPLELRKAWELSSLARKGKLAFDEASDRMSREMFNLNTNDIDVLSEILPDHCEFTTYKAS
jgi:hypothetical protein